MRHIIQSKQPINISHYITTLRKEAITLLGFVFVVVIKLGVGFSSQWDYGRGPALGPMI